MTLNQNAMIKLYKRGKSRVEIAKRLDMNCSTVWKNVKKFQETGIPLTDQAAEENGVSADSPLSSTHQKHQEKAATKLPPKLQNLAHRSRVSKSTIHQVLRNDLRVPGAYGQSCEHVGPKMQGNPPGDG